jgi:hypothetical protein
MTNPSILLKSQIAAIARLKKEKASQKAELLSLEADVHSANVYIALHETARARRHWATARAFVHVYLVRPYALFWHEFVGERLCAPGGKWAELDRAAFVEESM